GGVIRTIVVGLYAWHVAGETAARCRRGDAGSRGARRWNRAWLHGARPSRRLAFVRRDTVFVARRLRPAPLVVLDIWSVWRDRQTNVVRPRQIARLDLERGNQSVPREAARDGDVRPLDDVLRRTSRHAEFGSRHHNVGLDLPAVGRP